MALPGSKSVALVLQTRLEENVSILKGIAAYERAHEDWVFFLDDEAMSVGDPSWLFRKPWDGVICRHRVPTVLEECLRRGIPCVDLDDSERLLPGVPKVRPDNRAVGHLGAEHFLDQGFKHFGFCGFDSETWAVARRKGFVEGLEAVGCRCDVLETPYSHELTPAWDLEEQAAIKQWLESLPQPCAVMGCNDLRALQVINAAQEIGLKIPEEIAILGSNNETVRAELAHPPLSSIALNTLKWGQQAARILHRKMAGTEPPEETFVEPLKIEVRRSTDAFAIEDPATAKALGIIRAEACQDLRVEDLARRAGVSRSLLERRFRKFLRRTPQEEIRHARIARVKQYLIESDLPLSRIAELAGFEHPEYLSVMFKRLTGETPRDFRQRHRSLA